MAFSHWHFWYITGTALMAWTGVGLATALARRQGMLAAPGPRQSHSVPTPVGAGLGLVAAVVLAGWLPGPGGALPDIWKSAVLPGMALLCLVGWLDDRWQLSAWLRLSVQVAVSSWLLVSLGVQTGPAGSWAEVPVLLLFLVGVMNAFNFMDGSDGMAGSQGAFTALLLAWMFAAGGEQGLALAALGLAAACGGFLPWNLPLARCFMGDAGSVPLGFALAALLLLGWRLETIALPLLLLPLAVFLVDSGLTLMGRVLRGERWYTPHRQHVYQRLIAHGWTHGRVLAFYQAINLGLVLPGVILATNNPGIAWPVTGILLLVMITAWSFASLKLGGET